MWTVFLLAIGASAVWAGAPSWAMHDTQRLEGSVYRVVCSGLGPSIGFARQDAIDSCKASAAQHLSSDISVKSLSVTSERQSAYQQEVVNHAEVSGLVCIPRREEIQEGESQVRLWVLCEFDLSHAQAAAVRRAPSQDPVRFGSYETDQKRVLTLAVIPRCTDLIIRGGGPARLVRCDQNPVSVFLDPQDQEVLVRANGYFPKTLPLAANTEARSYEKVILEPND
ncbi:MAG: hypothetical protein ACXWPM_10925 [Bdellovibrionota bacterium]